jgi:hypothetical protein
MRADFFARSCLTGCAVLSLAAQTPREGPPPRLAGSGVIAGVVTDEVAKRPVRRVTVTLNGGDITNLLGITDDAGRFEFRGLPSGRYTLTAARPGYVTTSFGATRPGRAGTAVALADGQRLANITMRIIRGSVISGMLTTETGEPARDARLSVVTYGRIPGTGERVLMSAGPRFVSATDDRGGYRIWGLTPGEYFVVANTTGREGSTRQTTEAEYQRALQMMRGGGAAPFGGAAASLGAPAMGNAPTFFPGTTSVEGAQIITVGVAEERTGVNFTVRPVPVGRIDGTVIGTDGQPAANVLVTMIDSSRVPGILVGPMASRATADRDGRFSLTGLAPGKYFLVVRENAGGRGAPGPTATLWATTEVTTDGRDTTVTMTLQRGVTVSGKVVFENAAATPANLTATRVSLQPVVTGGGAAISVSPAITDATGGFSFSGVAPGSYRIAVTPPGSTPANPTWFTKTTTVRGQSTIDLPFEVGAEDLGDIEVRLTDRPVELAGTMRDGSGQPAPEYFLIAFPQDEARRLALATRVQQTRPAADGTFLFRGLAPGDYFLAAVTDVQPGEWFEPSFLKELAASAIRVALVEEQRKVQDIRVK